MTQVYDILGAVERHFKNNEENTNAVVFGQLDGTDLSKQTLFPLSHFAISDITYDENIIELTISVIALDVVNEPKEYDISFEGASNLQDVLNTQSTVINNLVEAFRSGRGYLAQKQYVLVGDPTAELLYEKFENSLTGWGIDITVQMPKNISAC